MVRSRGRRALAVLMLLAFLGCLVWFSVEEWQAPLVRGRKGLWQAHPGGPWLHVLSNFAFVVFVVLKWAVILLAAIALLYLLWRVALGG